MLILPLPAKPDWRSPPLVTLTLILLCCIIYFGFQQADGLREREAITFYMKNGLQVLELPRYLDDLDKRGAQDLANKMRPKLDKMTSNAEWLPVLIAMQDDQDFMARLHDGKVIDAQKAEVEAWSAARRQFDTLWGRIFTIRYALHPRAPEPLQVLMQMFMHADINHLMGNMAVLFVVAYTVEDLLGGWRFLLFYLLAGLGASLPDLFWPGEPGAISLGASGAIAGVMAMFVVLYGLRRIRFFYWVVVYFNTMRAPALVILPYWLGNEIWQKATDPTSHVNYLAHFAGLLSGSLLMVIYRQRRAGRSAEKLVQADLAKQIDQQRAVADDLLRRMEFARAARAYAALAVEYPDNADFVLRGFRAASMQADNTLLQNAIVTLYELTKANPQANAAETASAWLLTQQRQLKLPPLNLKQWLGLLRAWIDAGQLEAADQLLPRLLARDQGVEDALSALIYRLGLKRRKGGDEAACQAAWRLLAKRYPKSAEMRLVQAAMPSTGGAGG